MLSSKKYTLWGLKCNWKPLEPKKTNLFLVCIMPARSSCRCLCLCLPMVPARSCIMPYVLCLSTAAPAGAPLHYACQWSLPGLTHYACRRAAPAGSSYVMCLSTVSAGSSYALCLSATPAGSSCALYLPAEVAINTSQN
jgi:hypothetical protein